MEWRVVLRGGSHKRYGVEGCVGRGVIRGMEWRVVLGGGVIRGMEWRVVMGGEGS